MTRRKDERGAVAIVMAAATLVLVLIAAFAVDLGMQRVARRDMQSLADVVALDLVRELDGVRTVAVLGPLMPDLARESQERNESTIGETPGLEVELGELDDAGDFVVLSGSAIPTAVRVTSATSVGFAFVPGSGGAARSAIAQAQEAACFRIGTMAVGLATNQSALNGLLGDALDIGALGYNGLANANIALLGLEAALNALDPDGVADLKHVTLGDFVLAMATVLQNTPGHDTADVTLLQTIATKLDLAGEDGTVINLADMLDVDQGTGSGLGTTVNVLDILSGAAFIANGTNAISVPGLNLALAGVANLTTTLKVIERPRRGCKPGSGTAETSQVGLEITGNVNLGVPLVVQVTGAIKITVNLAEAMGRLLSATCVEGVATSMRIGVENQTLASTSVDLSGLTARALVGLLNVPLLGLSVSTNQPAPTGTYDLTLPTYYEPNAFHTPQTPASLPSVTSTQLSLLGINLGSLLSPVLNLVLNPLLTSINTLIVSTLAPALGLRIAGVDLFAQQPVECSAPALRG